MYFDLCVPLPRTATLADRARMAGELQSQGYHTIAFNTVIHGRPQKAHTCTASSSSTEGGPRRAPSLGSTPPPRQLNRITVMCDNAADVQALSVGSDVLQSYDIVAGQATTGEAFAALCACTGIDLVVVDVSARLPYHIAAKHAAAALANNVFFEVCYTPAIRSQTARRHLIANTRGLLQFTQGKGLVLSGDAEATIQVRSPLDVANIGQLMGLSEAAALAAVSHNVLRVLQRAEARRAAYQGISVTTVATSGAAAAAAAAAASDEEDGDR